MELKFQNPHNLLWWPSYHQGRLFNPKMLNILMIKTQKNREFFNFVYFGKNHIAN